jgi:amino acid adenylation domain-containing protein
MQLFEIEVIIRRCLPCPPNTTAIFADENKLSGWVLLQETNQTHHTGDLLKDLSAALLKHTGLHFITILLVPAGALARTADNTVNHNQVKKDFENSKVKTILRWDHDLPGRLKKLWSEILEIDEVGLEDNFFELGGHSLLAIQIFSRLRDEFNIDLSISVLFDAPSIKDLIAVIDKQARTAPRAIHSDISFLEVDIENRHQPFPLSDIQEAYWIGRRPDIELGGIATHGYLETRLYNFDLLCFTQALQYVIKRHDMLRAVVLPDGTQRIIAEVPDYEVKYVDLRNYDETRAQQELTQIRNELSHQLLPADQWPLFEFRATQINETETIVHISLDMLIMDAWSIQLVLRELNTLYKNPDTQLSALEISFRDYVLAERRQRETESYSESLAYWQKRLANFASGPELPLAKSPDHIKAARFARRQFKLAKPLWDSLKSRTHSARVTPSGVLLSAFACVLSAWSKNPRFTLNLTLFNRLPIHPQINSLVGDFTSLILLEINIDANCSFAQIARAIQTQLWQDMEHSAVSGVEVMRELNRQGGGIQPYIPIVFTSTLTDDVGDTGHLYDALGETLYSVSQTPQVWLDHQVFEQKDGLLLSWDVLEDIFPANMVNAMFNTYCELITQIATEDSIWEDPIPCMTPNGDLMIQAVSNATETPLSESLLHTAFEQQVLRNPTLEAVITPQNLLTYEHLHRLAKYYAYILNQQGAQPNQLVGIVMHKGWEQIVATLAVLYAGAAYLPLDPSLPEERLHHILAQSEARLVLLQPTLTAALSLPRNLHPIVIRPLEPDAQTPTAFHTPTKADDLAYVIYTSGSTGLPKGVEISHRGALNTILDINTRFKVSSNDRVFALSALGFDLSVFDIFGTLSAGGCIVIPDYQALRDPAHWLGLIDKYQVTLWNSVPALFAMLVEYAQTQASSLKSLRLAMLSGDWIPLTLPEKFKALVPSAEIVSLGGATEASIWSIVYPIQKVDNAWPSIPYGKPLDNQRFYVLDEAFNQRPIWVTGELYIGGIGLAKGYWRDQEKTDAAFITHPRTDERLYRTGDLGRYLPDGCIEFLGREDSQVKVQGYRIELGEIEAALMHYEGISQANVNTHGEKHAEKQLIAYLVLREGHRFDEFVLREMLAAKLPHYMIPSIYVVLDTLPLSANGKVDKKLLPLPQFNSSQSREDIKHYNREEQIITGIVKNILEVTEISPDTNLFHAGLTSLEVVRISNALANELNFRPKIEDLLTRPSLAKLFAMFAEQKKLKAPLIKADEASIFIKQEFSLIEEPEARRAFKEKQPGLRNFSTTDEIIFLPASNDELPPEYRQFKSVRKFCLSKIQASHFSRFLRVLSEQTIHGTPKYMYGSAGGLYPVQIYLYVKADRIEGIEEGVYYYHPKQHCLVAIAKSSRIPCTVYDHFVNRPIFGEAAFSLFFIANMAAIEPMYGEQSAKFCHIEAGAISQLLLASASVEQLGLCTIGTMDFDAIRPLFDLSPHHELIISMVGGKRMDESIPLSTQQDSIDIASLYSTNTREQGVI